MDPRAAAAMTQVASAVYVARVYAASQLAALSALFSGNTEGVKRQMALAGAS